MNDITAHRAVNRIPNGPDHDKKRAEALVDLLLARARNTNTDPGIIADSLESAARLIRFAGH